MNNWKWNDNPVKVYPCFWTSRIYRTRLNKRRSVCILFRFWACFLFKRALYPTLAIKGSSLLIVIKNNWRLICHECPLWSTMNLMFKKKKYLHQHFSKSKRTKLWIENLKHNEMAEWRCFGCLDTWPCNCKQTSSLRFPISIENLF